MEIINETYISLPKLYSKINHDYLAAYLTENREKLNQLREDIKENGLKKAVTINTRKEILDGFDEVIAFLELGNEIIPAKMVKE